MGLGLLVSCQREMKLVPPPGAAGSGPGYAAATGSAGATPHRVLFLHGFRGDPEQFEHYWHAALRVLPPRCEVYLVTGIHELMGALEPEGPERSTDDLEDFLFEQGIPLENLHLVAHSMGGLVARNFAARHPEALRQVFLLGTPNGGMRSFRGIDAEGWCTPEGIERFNLLHPPLPGIRWYVVAGDYYDGPLGGAFWEGVPNDGVVATASVLRFAELCPDSVFCETAVFPVIHPDWNWGENLLDSPRVIDWVLERILADLAREAAISDAETPE
jgi:pimeloyl-ACP methyl ester carboxylesterase